LPLKTRQIRGIFDPYAIAFEQFRVMTALFIPTTNDMILPRGLAMLEISTVYIIFAPMDAGFKLKRLHSQVPFFFCCSL
jgi:hypothetical protein